MIFTDAVSKPLCKAHTTSVALNLNTKCTLCAPEWKFTVSYLFSIDRLPTNYGVFPQFPIPASEPESPVFALR